MLAVGSEAVQQYEMVEEDELHRQGEVAGNDTNFGSHVYFVGEHDVGLLVGE